MSLITSELIIILAVLMACCLLYNFWKTRKLKTEPMLREQAVVHAKDHKTNRFDSLFTMEFHIVDRDVVVTCKVPYDVWINLEVGENGILSHKGGFLHSFEKNGAVYHANYSSGLPV